MSVGGLSELECVQGFTFQQREKNQKGIQKLISNGQNRLQEKIKYVA